MAHDTAILDIGSGKMTVLVGERGVNSTITVNGMGASEYDGFMDGQWINPDGAVRAMLSAIESAENVAGEKITALYVGVPGEFTSVVCKELSLSFPKRRKVRPADVFALMDSGDDFDESVYEVINIQPVYYTLDNDRRVLRPEGTASAGLGGVLSYVLAETGFTDFVREALKAAGITKVEFVSSALAEALLLFTEEQRDGTAVLIDVGYLTSSVAVVRGDGLLSLASFSMGGGHLAGDLATALGLTFREAENLKRKIMLSIAVSDNDIYEIEGKGGIKTLSAALVNDIALHRVTLIAKAVKKCLALAEYEYPDYIPYSLTGGGIAFMRGAKDVLAKELDRTVEVISPRMPQVNKPDMSSAWGLMDLAIRTEAPKRKGFFAKLFGK